MLGVVPLKALQQNLLIHSVRGWSSPPNIEQHVHTDQYNEIVVEKTSIELDGGAD